MGIELKDVLRRAGLLPLAFRANEKWETLIGYRPRAAADDGLPIPPASLRVRALGTARFDWFVKSSQLHAQLIRETLDKGGASLTDAEAILDFGCGCGRIARQWSTLTASVYGSDHDKAAIDWCRRNVPFATFTVNNLEPPLAYPDGAFDVVYAVSVFTHTTERLQRPWLEELIRVLGPQGRLLLTTHGGWAAAANLTLGELRRFDRGTLVLRDEPGGGSNLCAVFHPPSYVRESLASGLVEVAFRPAALSGQDMWVFRRKPLVAASTE